MASWRLILIALACVACSSGESVPQSGAAGADGGAAGQGGSPSGGAGTGAAAGTSGGAGTSGAAGTGAAGAQGGAGTGGPAGDPCAALGIFACDDFDTTAVGAELSGPSWNNPPATQQPRIVVDDARHHSGAHSIRVEGSAGGNFITPRMGFPPPTNRFYVRAYVNLDKSTADMGGPVSFIEGDETVDDTSERLRLGAARGMLAVSLAPGAKGSGGGPTTQYSNGDVGAATSAAAGVVLEANVWYCLEAVLDGESDEVQVWVDGQEVTSLHVSDWKAGRTSWSPVYAVARVGAQNLGGTAGTLWYDDIAFSTTSIGCVP
jgi:hypothetical protein